MNETELIIRGRVAFVAHLAQGLRYGNHGERTIEQDCWAVLETHRVFEGMFSPTINGPKWGPWSEAGFFRTKELAQHFAELYCRETEIEDHLLDAELALLDQELS